MDMTALDRALGRGAGARALRAGARLYRQGDEAARLYEVASGALRVARLTAGGRRTVLAFAHPGDVVGFASGPTHSAECAAITEARVLVHERAALERTGGDPDVQRRLARAALREIARAQAHAVTLGRRSAEERLATFLADLAARTGRARRGREGAAGALLLHLPMRRADVADHLGLTVETVSRSFTALRRAGLIALEEPHRVVVPDPSALRRAAEREGPF